MFHILRLTVICPLSIALVCGQPASAQSWFYSEEVDPFTDQVKQFAFGVPQGFQATGNFPYVRLGCYGPDDNYPVGLTINWATPVRDAYPDGDMTMAAVEVRFGDTDPLYLGMAMSDDQTQSYPMDPMSGGLAALGGGLVEAIIPGWEQPTPLLNAADFHAALHAAGGERLALRTQTAGGQQLTFVIPMDGFAEATASFREHCLPYDKPSGATSETSHGDAPTPGVGGLTNTPVEDIRAKLDLPVSTETDFFHGHLFEADGSVKDYLLSVATPTGEAFPPGIKVAYGRLPFYPDSYLLIGVPDDPLRRYYAIVDTSLNAMISLDGTADPILLYNKMRPPVLTSTTVSQYLMFFGYFVHAQDGGFYVADRMDGTLYANPSGRNAQDEARLAKTVSPVTCKAEPDDAFVCDAVLAYSDSLFRSDLRIEKDGTVAMLSEEVLLQGLKMRPVVAKMK